MPSAAPSVSPSPSTQPVSSPAPRPLPSPSAVKPPPAITVFRVTIDNPSSGAGRAGWGGTWAVGPPYDRVTGTVWLANDSLDTLGNVVLTIDFFNTHWRRVEGSKDYVLGTLGPKESTSIGYRWDNWQGVSVVPRVTVRYTQPGAAGVQTVTWDGYSP